MPYPLHENFVQFPVIFDASAILEELSNLSQQSEANNKLWQQHHFKEIQSIPLVDWVDQKMSILPILDQLPQVRQLLSQLDSPLGQSRIMKLDPGAKVNPHVDLKHYWKHRLRIHFVIQTAPEAVFGCNHQTLHLPAGQIWVSNSWAEHWVQNNSTTSRIHIVVDTIGSEKVWQWIKDGWNSSLSTPPTSNLPLLQVDESTVLTVEKTHRLQKRHPAEVWEVLQDILNDLPSTQHSHFKDSFQQLYRVWQRHHLNYPQTYRWSFKQTLQPILQSIARKDTLLSFNKIPVSQVIDSQLIDSLNVTANIQRPIFIIGAPQSGIFQLQNQLVKHRHLWSNRPLPFDPFDQLDTFHPSTLQSASNWIQFSDSTPEKLDNLKRHIADSLCDSRNIRWLDQHTRLLSKPLRWLFASSKNCFRIPLLHYLFPNAQFICLWDNPHRNLHQIIEGWKSKNFVTYPDLHSWHGKPWSFVLPPQWQKLPPNNIPHIANYQYQSCNRQMFEDTQNLSSTQCLHVHSEDLFNHPTRTLQKMCQFIEEPFGSKVQQHNLKPAQIDQSAWLHNSIQLMEQLPPLIQEFQTWHKELGISNI